MVRRTTPAASWSFTSRSFDTISSILAIASLRAARFSLGNSGGKPTIRRFYRLRRTNRLAGMPCTAISTGRHDALPLPGSRTMAAAQAESAGVRPVRPTATSGRYASPRMARGRSFPPPAGWRTGPGRGGHRARAGGPAAPLLGREPGGPSSRRPTDRVVGLSAQVISERFAAATRSGPATRRRRRRGRAARRRAGGSAERSGRRRGVAP